MADASAAEAARVKQVDEDVGALNEAPWIRNEGSVTRAARAARVEASPEMRDVRAMMAGLEERKCAQCWAVAGPGDAPTLLCSGCRRTWYCGAACQRAAWPAHKAACRNAAGTRGAAGAAPAAPATHERLSPGALSGDGAGRAAVGAEVAAAAAPAAPVAAAAAAPTAPAAAASATAASAPPLTCLLCGGAAERRCARCKAVSYCSREHQERDWHRHKVACRAPGGAGAAQASPASAARAVLSSLVGPDIARLVQAAVPCSRCQRSVGEGGPCRVPHPASKRRTLQGRYDRTGCTMDYACEACGRNFSTVVANGVESVLGEHWCFEADEHVVGPLPANDCRRVDVDSFELLADGQLQQRIAALPAGTRVLTISVPDTGLAGEERGLSLCRSLPALEELRIDQVEFDEIVLNAELTPRLRKLRLHQCLAGECRLVVELPELIEFDTQFYRGDDAPLNIMLTHATKLETFESYKCWIGRLTFASNALKSVTLHRADSLTRLELWAPNLSKLNVQGCFGLDKIIFTKEHPLKALLPPGHRSPRFRVNAANANLGPAARSALNNNPCCAGIDEASGGGPRDMMASMFQQMHVNTASGNGRASEDEEDENDENENDEEEEIQHAD
jgi:hypothetical protein